MADTDAMSYVLQAERRRMQLTSESGPLLAGWQRALGEIERLRLNVEAHATINRLRDDLAAARERVAALEPIRAWVADMLIGASQRGYAGEYLHCPCCRSFWRVEEAEAHLDGCIVALARALAPKEAKSDATN